LSNMLRRHELLSERPSATRLFDASPLLRVSP
jgi:hypothetical protein